MTNGRYSRRNATFRPTGARRSDRENNFFLGIVGLSLFIHIIVAAIFLHNPAARVQHRPPTLSVNLVLAPPVAKPQRGSASVLKKVAVPVAVPQPPATTTPLPKEQVVVKGKEVKKTADSEDDDILKSIAKMKRRKADQDELNDAQATIAALKKKKNGPVPAAAVGTASGTGDEAGGAIGDWLQNAVKEEWVWSGKKRKELSAAVEVTFDSTGKLNNYRIIRTSGDTLFDKSLTNALLKLEALPKELRKPFQETIVFNLDDLQGQ